MEQKRQTASGAKAHQRDDTEWRAKTYSQWHRTLDRALLMTDVDFIEWRYRNGELIAVGVMEATRVDVGIRVNHKYLDAIIARFEQRDMQAKAACQVAAGLQTKAYIILFRQDCSEFWMYNLTDTPYNPTNQTQISEDLWQHYTPQEMEDFLKAL